MQQCTCALLSRVAGPALQYFSALSHKQHVFWEQVTEYKMCIFISYTNLSAHSKKKWKRYAYKCILVCEYNALYSKTI